MVLEDLDQPSRRGDGFPVRKSGVSVEELQACLSWLANFHAAFISIDAPAVDDSLWPVGTYWHLATRWDEWDVMEAGKLKDAFQTLVHGDAKLANFCFPASSGPVAAVDFQYVGRGCGMKDVAYLISSCLSDAECKRQQESLLNAYFNLLEGRCTATVMKSLLESYANLSKRRRKNVG